LGRPDLSVLFLELATGALPFLSAALLPPQEVTPPIKSNAHNDAKIVRKQRFISDIFNFVSLYDARKHAPL
jgi:hypothetical protein